ncbi:MAG: exonuclease SbcCD subunit D [Chloroflexota bacterium]
MKTRFLHFADCHLGYRQYNNKERYNDFARGFFSVVDQAIQEQVDFVILAGDLFEKRAIDAMTLNQAMRGLENLRKANIPCIAVEGNHELAYQDEYMGWMKFLEQRELLILLDPRFSEGVPQLAPYKNRRGSYIDLDQISWAHTQVPGVRVYGMKYRGSGTAKALEGYAKALDKIDKTGVEYNIFVAHAGLEGVLAGHSGGLSFRQWSVIKPHIDYVAIGHIHKPFDEADWLYNPGSTETCTMTEAAWPKRGYYIVDVDTNRETKDEDDPKHAVTLYENPKRVFHRLTMKVDLHTTPEALTRHCEVFLKRRAADLLSSKNAKPGPLAQPVVELQLTGTLAFDRRDFDIATIETLVEEIFSPLVTRIKNQTNASDFTIETNEHASRSELEKQVLSGLMGQDARYQGQNEAWAGLALSLKNLALGGAGGEEILDELAGQVEKLDSTPQQGTQP